MEKHDSDEAREAVLGPVLIVSAVGGSTRRYRCDHLQEQLALLGIKSQLREADDPVILLDVLDSHVLILHRVPFTPLIDDLLRIARGAAISTIFETDDLTFDPSVLPEVRILSSFSPVGVQQFHDSVHGQLETLKRCDWMMTTTESLAAAGEALGRRCYVHRNACSQVMIERSEIARQAQQAAAAAGGSDRQTVTLGYFSGSASHDHDFASIATVLVGLFESHAALKLRLVGPLKIDSCLAPYRNRIEQVSFVPWEELPSQIAQVDINLAPLERNSRFCDAKSEIKFVEAALVGVVTVASPTQAFRHAITHGATGYLADRTEDWQRELENLINDRPLREKVGATARETVLQAYSPTVRSGQLIKFLFDILPARSDSTHSPAESIALAKSILRDRMRALKDDNFQLEDQLRSLRFLIPRVLQLFLDRLRAVWQRKSC